MLTACLEYAVWKTADIQEELQMIWSCCSDWALFKLYRPQALTISAFRQVGQTCRWAWPSAWAG